MTNKIGEVAGYGEYQYKVEGYLLHHDGCQQVGAYLDTERKDRACDWADGFNRQPKEVIKMVDRLPLTREEKVELLEKGKFPSNLQLNSHHYYFGYPKENMFKEVIHLLP